MAVAAVAVVFRRHLASLRLFSEEGGAAGKRLLAKTESLRKLCKLQTHPESAIRRLCNFNAV